MKPGNQREGAGREGRREGGEEGGREPELSRVTRVKPGNQLVPYYYVAMFKKSKQEFSRSAQEL